MPKDKDKIYDQIDNDESLTDQEKRDAYFSEINEDEAREQWEENQ